MNSVIMFKAISNESVVIKENEFIKKGDTVYGLPLIDEYNNDKALMQVFIEDIEISVDIDKNTLQQHTGNKNNILIFKDCNIEELCFEGIVYEFGEHDKYIGGEVVYGLPFKDEINKTRLYLQLFNDLFDDVEIDHNTIKQVNKNKVKL